MIAFTTALVRLLLALVLGALIGLERERSERAAGLRTHALVALGSALIMLVSSFGFGDTLGIPNAAYDPSRVAAQVVSGIGFIGAGAILLRREIVRGLTTAAGIWLVAGVGLACGAGMLAEAAVTTALALIVLAALRPLERKLFPHQGRHLLRLYVDPAVVGGPLLGQVHEIFRRAGATVDGLQMRATKRGELIDVQCHSLDPERMTLTLPELRALPGVRDVRVQLGLARHTGRGYLEPFGGEEEPE
ncbi:MAG TPA: MgtC/SapB family protein [Ktedonobacterales bacterium]